MIKVTLGEHNRCNETHRPETRYVIEVIAHNFTYVTFKDDIALLRLSDRVTVTDTIKPVCLPHNDGEYKSIELFFSLTSFIYSSFSKVLCFQLTTLILIESKYRKVDSITRYYFCLPAF